MTKLVEWLSAIVVIVAVWYALLTQIIMPDFYVDHPLVACLWPVGLVALFGIYSIAVSTLVESFSMVERKVIDQSKLICLNRMETCTILVITIWFLQTICLLYLLPDIYKARFQKSDN